MPDDPYSLTDLARLGEVTPRTIRYYVAQGLLPSPDAAGPATRYGEGHLARLRLIKRLQRDHLPLAEIRVRLERMGDEAIQASLDAADATDPEPPVGSDATLAYVRDLMTRAGVAPRFYDQPGTLHTRVEAEWMVPDEFPLREAPEGAPPLIPMSPPWATPSAPTAPAVPAPLRSNPTPAGPAPRSTTGDRSTWERLVITPDVELHVRRPLDRATNKRVDRLERIARELFDEEP